MRGRLLPLLHLLSLLCVALPHPTRAAAQLPDNPVLVYLDTFQISVVLAQGLCGYTVIDTDTGAELPVDGEIGVRGVNGEVVGWAVLD